MRILILLASIATAAAAGCGDDAPAPDGSVDAATIGDAAADTSLATPCETLCSCMTQYCGDEQDACMAACAAAPSTVQTCWIQH